MADAPRLVADKGAGHLITLEGSEGAGKSTQAARLAEALRRKGHAVCLTREPGGTELGEGIRELLLHASAGLHPRADALLFNAARTQLVHEVIGPALASGQVVVCDRFADSTLAYQGGGDGLDPEALDWLARWATAGLSPDLTILLDLPVEEGLARRGRGPASELTRFEDGERHDRAFHERVRSRFRWLAAEDPRRWRLLDASAPRETVAAQILGLVEHVLLAGGGHGEPQLPAPRIT